MSGRNRETEPVAFAIGNVKPHSDPGPELEVLAINLSYERLGLFLIDIIIVHECSDGHKSFHEMVEKLYIKPLTDN
jgi:hypothetical protein